MNTFLLNPFKKYQESTLLVIGTIATVLGSMVVYFFNARFDRVIDMHLVVQISLWQPFADNAINILCLVPILFLISKYLNRKTRIIDILTTVIVARMPYYILPLFNANGYLYRTTQDLAKRATSAKLPDISAITVVVVLVFALISIIFLTWYIILLFNGFKVSSNAKGAKSIFLFIVGILVAEFVSKFIIFKLS